MKVLFTTSSFNIDLIPQDFDFVLNPFGRKLTEQELIDLLKKHNPVAIVAGVESITKQVLTSTRALKVISRVGSGVDSIDLDSAQELGIKVLNTPDAATNAVAELTIGLILNLIRSVSRSDLNIKKGLWIRPMGNLLFNKTVGIIGCGRIGTRVSQILKCFGCNVIGYDSYLTVHEDILLTSMEHLLASSDIITLHIPYSENTHNLIDNDEIQLMKENCFIINTSRGGLINESTLYNSLVSGRIKGAAIDCFEFEPYSGSLLELDNVILTAHIGSYAIESRNIMEVEAIKNVINSLL